MFADSPMLLAQVPSPAVAPSMCVSGPGGIVQVFTWDLRFIVLSVVVAIVGSYAALECAERMRATAEPGIRRRLFLTGAGLMGLAIWTMHFVGMLALNMHMPVSYAASWSIASIVAAVAGAGIAFQSIAKRQLTLVNRLAAAIAMGLAIASMHYLGMKSLRMTASIDYDPRRFFLSIAIAVLTSGAALKIGRSIPSSPRAAFYVKSGSAVVMGLAIAGMHYVGMAAARYTATPLAENRIDDPRVGTLALSNALAVAATVFGIALVILAARSAVERERALADNERLIAELEERVRRRTAELEARNAELEAFSYTVSHDLRTPLRTIAGFSDALLDSHAGALNEEGQHFLQRIKAAGERMENLLEGLLTLARVSQAPLKVDEVDLAEIARSVLADMAAAQPERNVEIVVPDALPACGDRALLTSALQNLLGNAWKFTAKNPHPRIEIGVRTEGGQQFFYVADNGAGFDMANVQKLFGMFERLHGVAEFAGNGIGLAVTKRIVERHGGRIFAHSVRNERTEFTFTLPPVRQPA